MNRADKIKLLKEIVSGSKTMADFLPPKWIEMVEYDDRPGLVRYDGKFISKEEASRICAEAEMERKRSTRIIWIEVLTCGSSNRNFH